MMGILNLVSNITEAFHDFQFDTVLFCDLSKAFDCVDHGILLRKLQVYGFCPESIALLRSYLDGRSQTVRCSGLASAKGPVTVGVPQSSVLGPILFLIYINDLPSVDQSSKYTLFADDTTVSVKADSMETSVGGSLVAQEMAEGWFCSNRLLLNRDKTNRVVFTMRDSQGINSHISEVKFLGVFLDSKLQWGCHIDHLASKLARGLHLLRSLSNNVSQTVLRTAYFAVFHSQLSYAIIVWGHAADTHRLFRLQRRAVRLLAGLGYGEDCRAVFRDSGVLTVPSLYILENLLYVKKNLHMYVTHGDVHGYETRNRGELVPGYWRLRRCQSGIGYWAIKFFNVLPLDIKSLPVTKFKTEMRKLLIRHTFYSFDEYLKFDFSVL